MERRSSTRAVPKPVSATEIVAQTPVLLKERLEANRLPDVLGLVQQAAGMRSAISQLEIPEINTLMATLEELRSASLIALNERLTKNEPTTK